MATPGQMKAFHMQSAKAQVQGAKMLADQRAKLVADGFVQDTALEPVERWVHPDGREVIIE